VLRGKDEPKTRGTTSPSRGLFASSHTGARSLVVTTAVASHRCVRLRGRFRDQNEPDEMAFLGISGPKTAYTLETVRLSRALLVSSVLAWGGCSRTNLSSVRSHDVGDAGEGQSVSAPAATHAVSTSSPDGSGRSGMPEAGPQTAARPPGTPPPPPAPIARDGGREASAAVLPDAATCEVAAPTPGRLVGAWASSGGEIALASWNTGDGSFAEQPLGIHAPSASLAVGPGEFGVAAIVTERLDDGGFARLLEMYRVKVESDAGKMVTPALRTRSDGIRGVAVVWTGDRYLLAWMDDGHIWIQRVSRDGAIEGDAHIVFDGHPVWTITLASRVTGEVGLLWEDYDKIRGAFFALLDDAGTPLTAPVWVTGDAHSANHRLVATRDGYAASYIQNTNDAFVTVFDTTGTIVTRSLVDEACFSQWTCESSTVSVYGGSSLASNGCEIGLFYEGATAHQSRGLRLARLRGDGAVLQNGISIAEGASLSWPLVGWDAAHGYWGVVWRDDGSDDSNYAAVGPNGIAFTRAIPSNGIRPSLNLAFVPDDWR